MTTATINHISLSPEQVLTVDEFVRPVIASGDTGSILEYILFERKNSILNIVGTDGSRLVHFETEATGDNKTEDSSILVSLKQWDAFRKTGLKAIKSTGWLIKADDATVTITNCKDVFVADKRLNAQYPRYQELFPSREQIGTEFYLVWSKPSETLSHSKKYTYEPVLSEVDQLVMHAENIARADKATKCINLDLVDENGNARFDVGMTGHKYFKYSARVYVKGGFTGRVDQRISFCGDYLIDALDHKQLVKVELQLPRGNDRQNLKPATFTYPNTKGVRHLLMPIQCK